MTAKQYVQSIKQNLVRHTSELESALKTKKNLCNAGTVITGLVGLALVATNFWMAIPVISLAVALQMRKNAAIKMFNKTMATEQDQVQHLDSVLANGIDVRPAAQAARKQKMDAIEATRKKANETYLNANAKSHYASAGVIGTAALGILFTNPITALLPAAALLIKNAADQNMVATHAVVEEAGANLNKEIYDYNTSSYANAGKIVPRTNSVPSQAHQVTTQRTASRTAQPVRKPAEVVVKPATQPVRKPAEVVVDRNVSAVDRYMQMLEQQKQADKAAQKRKV